jgi:short subunit fatty acids transporter
MQEWFEALSTFEKILWYISVPFTLIFIIQLVLTIAGLDGRKLNKKIDEQDTEEVIRQADVKQKKRSGLVSFGLSFFSLRNFIVFLMVFGWMGVYVYNKGFSRNMTILIAGMAGILTMIIFSALFYLSHKVKKQY